MASCKYCRMICHVIFNLMLHLAFLVRSIDLFIKASDCISFEIRLSPNCKNVSTLKHYIIIRRISYNSDLLFFSFFPPDYFRRRISFNVSKDVVRRERKKKEREIESKKRLFIQKFVKHLERIVLLQRIRANIIFGAEVYFIPMTFSKIKIKLGKPHCFRQ